MAALLEPYEQNIKAPIALAILTTLLPACNQSANPKADTKISEIANGLNVELIGKTVTVSGEVDQILGPQAFIIEGEQLFNDPEVLVVIPLKLQ